MDWLMDIQSAKLHDFSWMFYTHRRIKFKSWTKLKIDLNKNSTVIFPLHSERKGRRSLVQEKETHQQKMAVTLQYLTLRIKPQRPLVTVELNSFGLRKRRAELVFVTSPCRISDRVVSFRSTVVQYHQVRNDPSFQILTYSQFTITFSQLIRR
jgi:hypothetical protein